jgi:hypothetical protein
MEIGWTDVGSGGYILVSCAHSNTSFLLLVVLGTDCIGSYKSNYHTIITAPLNTIKVQLNFVEIDGTNDFTLN